jgi:DNA-binding CsgD family transcriptional regulator
MLKVELVAPNFLGKGTGHKIATTEKNNIKKFAIKHTSGNYSINTSVEHLLIKLNSVKNYEDIPDTITFSYHSLIERNLDFKETLDVINLTAKLAAAKFDKRPKEIVFTGWAGDSALDDYHEKIVSAGFLGCTLSPRIYGIEAAEEATYRHTKDPSYWSPEAFSNKKIVVTESLPLDINLTFRQHQIMTMICTQGMTNYQIARRLSLSEATVKMHIGLVLKKYGVKNRSQLIFHYNKEKIG